MFKTGFIKHIAPKSNHVLCFVLVLIKTEVIAFALKGLPWTPTWNPKCTALLIVTQFPSIYYNATFVFLAFSLSGAQWFRNMKMVEKRPIASCSGILKQQTTLCHFLLKRIVGNVVTVFGRRALKQLMHSADVNQMHLS